ncbi:unnamed protein product [Phytophthora lilii]|uniref:Unnamed protein product n=1 Tax=Phytophthora lilii TaxID=2077276 RepID=A0A9W7D5N5_9STRA|nr:unnamed protein product [Phytophthora lilii]
MQLEVPVIDIERDDPLNDKFPPIVRPDKEPRDVILGWDPVCSVPVIVEAPKLLIPLIFPDESRIKALLYEAVPAITPLR